MRSRARARLPASASATFALLFAASAFVASADATRPSLGLESMGTEACAETQAFCEGTVMDAVRADAKLVAFLTDARDSADSSSADTDASLADAHRATAASGALKFPELLALGCCLTAGGDCAADILARTPRDDPDAARSAADAADASAAAAAEILVLAASHPDASRLPASRLLAANAFACQPPRAASRCGRELVQLYRRAGTEGFDIGTVRAGEILLARYAGDRVDPSGGGACPEVIPGEVRSKRRRDDDDDDDDASSSAGDPVDAADARMLFKSLLAGDLDRRAAARLRELATVEEMRVASRPDEAYLAADALVRVVGRWLTRAAALAALLALGAPAARLATRAFPFLARVASPVGWARGVIGGTRKRWRRLLENFGAAPIPRAGGGGRQGARAERRESAKKEQRRRKQS